MLSKRVYRPASIESTPQLHRITQGLQLAGVVGFALFDQAQATAQHFAGVLEAPAFNPLLHQLGLVVGNHDIARGHGIRHQQEIGRLCRCPAGRAHVVVWKGISAPKSPLPPSRRRCRC